MAGLSRQLVPIALIRERILIVRGERISRSVTSSAGIKFSTQVRAFAIMRGCGAVAGIGDPGGENGSHQTGIIDPAYNRDDTRQQLQRLFRMRR
jgi:hypothetical protein